MTMSEHMQLGAALDAGLLAGLLRAIFGGESLFVQTVTASDDGDATFCAEEVGDIELIDLHAGGSVLVQKGAFLASHDTVELHSTTQLSARKVVHCPQSQFASPAYAGAHVHGAHPAYAPHAHARACTFPCFMCSQKADRLRRSQALGSGAGLFVLEASGRGTLAVNAMGGILRCRRT